MFCRFFETPEYPLIFITWGYPLNFSGRRIRTNGTTCICLVLFLIFQINKALLIVSNESEI